MFKVIPFERSYWVIPGKLLAGNLPARTEQNITQNNINKLTNLGIRTFINLMEETEHDFDGSILPSYEKTLKDITKNVNCDFYRLPITDMKAPSFAKMTSILNKIDESINTGKPVYVHCWGGKGRTGTVVGCYMVRHGMATGQFALDMIKYFRRTDPKVDMPSPETKEQIDMVLGWKTGK